MSTRLHRRLSALRAVARPGCGGCPGCHRDLAPEEPCFCQASEPMMALDRALYGMNYKLTDGRRVSPLDREVRALW